MNDFIQNVQKICDICEKYLKENSAKENMTPKEYGIYLSKRGKRKNKSKRR